MLVALVCTGATCNDKDPNNGSTAADASVQKDATPLVVVDGIATDKLTQPEHKRWSGYMSEFLAPCPDVAVPLNQCVQEKRDCKACKPAAEFLLRQARAGMPKAEVAELYDMRFNAKSVKTIALGDSPAKGPKDAVVTLVEFADFECPACMMVYPLVEEMYRAYGKHMRVVYKHFPLEQHTNAKLAAQASYAAHLQGQFWQMHGTLFQAQGLLTEPDLAKYAKKIGLDMKRFTKDLHSDRGAGSLGERPQAGRVARHRRHPHAVHQWSGVQPDEVQGAGRSRARGVDSSRHRARRQRSAARCGHSHGRRPPPRPLPRWRLLPPPPRRPRPHLHRPRRNLRLPRRRSAAQ